MVLAGSVTAAASFGGFRLPQQPWPRTANVTITSTPRTTPFILAIGEPPSSEWCLESYPTIG